MADNSLNSPTPEMSREPYAPAQMSRRNFLRNTAILSSAVAAMSAALAPLRELDEFPTMEEFLQKHYKELTPEEMDRILKRIAAGQTDDLGDTTTLADASVIEALVAGRLNG